MNVFAIVLGVVLSVVGYSGDDDTFRIMGQVWLAAAFVLASIPRKA